jgi:hypothetical protein
MQLKRAGAGWNISWVTITLTLWNWGGALGLNHYFQWQLVKTVIIWILSSLGLFVNASVTENNERVFALATMPLPLPCPVCNWKQRAGVYPGHPALPYPCPAPACHIDKLPLPCPCPMSLISWNLKLKGMGFFWIWVSGLGWTDRQTYRHCSFNILDCKLPNTMMNKLRKK